MKKEIFSEVPPSEEFNEALDRFWSRGSIYAECGHCHRVFFNSEDRGCFEEGELDELRKKAEEDPDTYIEVDYSIPHGILNGSEYVTGCPCNYAKFVEDVFDRYAELAIRYFTNKLKSKVDEIGWDVRFMRNCMDDIEEHVKKLEKPQKEK